MRGRHGAQDLRQPPGAFTDTCGWLLHSAVANRVFRQACGWLGVELAAFVDERGLGASAGTGGEGRGGDGREQRRRCAANCGGAVVQCRFEEGLVVWAEADGEDLEHPGACVSL